MSVDQDIEEMDDMDTFGLAKAMEKPKITGLDLVRERAKKEAQQDEAEAKRSKTAGESDKDATDIDEKDAGRRCVVCMIRAVCVAYSPCTHASCCATCADKSLTDKPTCVSCRATVASVALVSIQSV